MTYSILSWSTTWSPLLVCRRRCLKKSRREHFLTRMRSVVPSARWAEGDRPFGLRGHAQLILAALMAINFPRITLQRLLLSSETEDSRAGAWPHIYLIWLCFDALGTEHFLNCSSELLDILNQSINTLFRLLKRRQTHYRTSLFNTFVILFLSFWSNVTPTNKALPAKLWHLKLL